MTYQEFFDLAKIKGIDKIQVTEDEQKENSIYLINNKLEDYTNSDKKVYTIKAEIDGKTESVFTEYLDESIIDLLIEKLNSTDSKYENEYLYNKINKIDELTKTINVNDTKKIIEELYSEKNNYPLTKSLEIAYSETYNKTRIINNNNVDIATDSLCYELYVEASAEKEGSISTYSESILETNKEKFDFSKTINNVLKLAELAVNKQKLETRKYNIILSNKVASNIIDHIQDMLSAELIHQKKSCLSDTLNKKIFSEKLNIVEEPRNKEYPGYIIFDKEGTETRNKDIVKNGEIKTYLYDIKEAKVDNTESTGNKYNGIAGRNMYVKPGDKQLDELFKEIDSGLYITHYMGSMGSSINDSTGSISMQVFGYIIENGKLKSGFEPAVLTSSIFELLSNIENIGNDLQFMMKSSASPSLYITGISIAGE